MELFLSIFSCLVLSATMLLQMVVLQCRFIDENVEIVRLIRYSSAATSTDNCSQKFQ